MSASDRIFHLSRQRTASATQVTRSDLRITDYRRVGSNQVKLLFQYDPVNGHPSKTDIHNWFGGRIGRVAHPNLDSGTRFHNQPCFTIFASLTQQTRPISDAKVAGAMHNFGVGVYQDTATGVLWDVQENPDGSKHLVARSDEDVDAIFKRHVQRSQDRRTASTLKQIEDSRIASRVYNVGDTVKFVDGDSILRGDVKSCNGAQCTVTANGGSMTIDANQIVDVVRRAENNVNEERGGLESYFSQAFGSPEYADELTQTMTKDVAKQQNPASAPKTASAAMPASTGPRKY